MYLSTDLYTPIGANPRGNASGWLNAWISHARGRVKRCAVGIGCSHRTIQQRIARDSEWPLDDALAVARTEPEIQADMIRLIVGADPAARQRAMRVLEAMCKE